jgi:hypothetical protein
MNIKPLIALKAASSTPDSRANTRARLTQPQAAPFPQPILRCWDHRSRASRQPLDLDRRDRCPHATRRPAATGQPFSGLVSLGG